MISVLTMTYQRSHILEEAIYSFINQSDLEGVEMVILNDSPEVSYCYSHPNVRVINLPQRFPTISQKLAYGFKECFGDWIYRLDDDDLLLPDAMKIVKKFIQECGDADICRSKRGVFFQDNVYQCEWSNVNNGNIFSKSYTQRMNLSNVSIVEDVETLYGHGAKIYEGEECTMIYRWNRDTFHISALGVENAQDSNYLFQRIDEHKKESGVITLNPHFKNDYWNR